MKKYIITFGQKYRFERHPYLPKAHPDGYVTIFAREENEARIKAAQLCGTNEGKYAFYAFLYDAEDFDYSLYPLGELARY